MSASATESAFLWLDSLRAGGIRPGLDLVRELATAVGNPETSFRSVLIAGTNGKGSVAAMLSSGCAAAGLRTGLFTSPHLVHVRERYRLDDRDVADGELACVLEELRRASGSLDRPPTYFEATTVAAFLLFARRGCDLAVLEVGMGGRLDATNLADPILSIVTRIGLDHTRWLGESLREIAGEKAGVLRPGRPFVMAPQEPEAEAALIEAAVRIGARAIPAARGCRLETSSAGGIAVRTPSRRLEALRPALAGPHQRENLVVALRGLEVLEEQLETGDPWPDEVLRRAVEGARLAGRLQTIAGDPALLLDGAHNPLGAEALAAHLEEQGLRPVLLFSCLEDKDAGAMLAALAPRCREIVLCRLSEERAATLDQMATAARRAAPGASLHPAGPVPAGLSLARRLAREAGTFVLGAGSLYLVGALLEILPAEEGWDRMRTPGGSEGVAPPRR